MVLNFSKVMDKIFNNFLRFFRVVFGPFRAALGAQTWPICNHNLWLHLGQIWAPRAAQNRPKNSRKDQKQSGELFLLTSSFF